MGNIQQIISVPQVFSITPVYKSTYFISYNDETRQRAAHENRIKLLDGSNAFAAKMGHAVHGSMKGFKNRIGPI